MNAAERVVVAGRALAAAGQQDMVWGHVALRDEAGRGVWLKRSGTGYDELETADVHLVGWNGQVVVGGGAPHLESHIHLAIMQARPDVVMSVHAHAPAANAFSALDEPLRAISHDGVLFVEPQIPRSGLSGDLVADKDRGAALAAALGDSRACLMPRHGFVAVGRNDAEAVITAVLLEAACRLHLDARGAGEIRSFSDAAEVSDKREHVWPQSQFDAGFAYLVRRANR